MFITTSVVLQSSKPIINYNQICQLANIPILKNSKTEIKKFKGQQCNYSHSKDPVLKFEDQSCDSRHTEKSTKHLQDGPSLSYFIPKSSSGQRPPEHDCAHDESYFKANLFHGQNRSVYIETYGCQMNVNDTEIVWSILNTNGFVKASTITEADVVLLVTCAIREGAEEKIWSRLHALKGIKKKRGKRNPLKLGLLGCMAERLKTKILEKEKMVDIVCGPDAYRDLPHLLSVAAATDEASVNVQLSMEETYADVIPVRLNPGSISAYVSIMRGCDNMCTYCIVPFTRGRERSRPIASILEEVNSLSEQGVKDVTLLGQNVNSYRDSTTEHSNGIDVVTQISPGFSTVYKPKLGGQRFAALLKAVAQIDPEMRIRFTSPHPKDFPDEVLQTILTYPNICKQIHLPAQSGNSQVLSSMGRGYTREAYLELVENIRKFLPNVGLSSDFISGFCGETEEAHQDTLSLMDIVKYNYAFCFPYSMREKTRAYHRLKDDVPPDVKSRRHLELYDRQLMHSKAIHESQTGQKHLVLVEGDSKRSVEDLVGRNDLNTKVIFPKVSPIDTESIVQPGDYVVVEIASGTSFSLKGKFLYKTTLTDFHRQQNSVLKEKKMLQ
ncbi:CDK5 regulatory subunit associated protein 1 [Bulinus truncatus]|nr:CDK5 regulatory subunit associated protein 1 [Bulinus truncatus]